MSPPPLAGAESARALAARLKKRWRKENAADAAAALAAHPELARHPSVAVELAYEEYLLLERAGAAPGPESFAARFPAFRARVHSVIAVHRQLLEDPDLLADGADDADDADWPQPGETVAGVELMEVLGGGGFARAYLAYDPETDRPCVLKLTAGPSAEAQVIGRLNHPHVTGVYWAKDVDGRTAVCMPLIGSSTLAEVIAAAFPADAPAAESADVILTTAAADDPADDAPAGEVVRAGEPYRVGAAAVAAKVADAVAYLHRQGVAHGDLKPVNVVVGRRGSPLLIDFNLSTRSAGPAAVRGTPGYVAPELLEAADPLATTADLKRADLFALGVLVTELLTGRRPFPPADPTSFAAQAAAARTPPVIAAAVPRAVAKVLRACLSPDPAARPASAAVLAAALDRVVTAARNPLRWRVAAAVVAVAALGYGLSRPSPPPPPPPPDEARQPVTPAEFIARGRKSMTAADWVAARSDFVTADRLAPKQYPWAVALAAYCATVNGNHDDAIGYAERVDRDKTGGAPADVLNVIGYAHLQRGRVDEALLPLERAVRESGLPAAHYNRALVRLRLGVDPAGAADDMQRALTAAESDTAELHADAARVFAFGAAAAPGLRAEALRHVRAAVGMGTSADSLRGESVFRARFRGGLGSRLAFEAACAAPPGPAAGKSVRLRLVEPQPF